MIIMITIINIVIIIKWVFSFSLLSSNFYWRDNEHCNDMGQNVHVRGQNKKKQLDKIAKSRNNYDRQDHYIDHYDLSDLP